jgi:hypothetical protein
MLALQYSQVFETLHCRPCCRDRALDSNSLLISQQLTIPLKLPALNQCSAINKSEGVKKGLEVQQ